VKSSRPSRPGHETKVGRKTDAQEFWSGNVQEEEYWTDAVEYNTEVHFKEIGWEDVETTNFARKKYM